jgi:hypothetical protein
MTKWGFSVKDWLIIGGLGVVAVVVLAMIPGYKKYFTSVGNLAKGTIPSGYSVPSFFTTTTSTGTKLTTATVPTGPATGGSSGILFYNPYTGALSVQGANGQIWNIGG